MAENGHSKAWLIELIPLAIMGIKRLFQRKHEYVTIAINDDPKEPVSIHLLKCINHKSCYKTLKVKHKPTDQIDSQQ